MYCCIYTFAVTKNVVIFFLDCSDICVYVQDGMTWLLNPPDQTLPLILADQGFDVWIANTRGTRFSRKHVILDPSQPVSLSLI